MIGGDGHGWRSRTLGDPSGTSRLDDGSWAAENAATTGRHARWSRGRPAPIVCEDRISDDDDTMQPKKRRRMTRLEERESDELREMYRSRMSISPPNHESFIHTRLQTQKDNLHTQRRYDSPRPARQSLTSAHDRDVDNESRKQATAIDEDIYISSPLMEHIERKNRDYAFHLLDQHQREGMDCYKPLRMPARQPSQAAPGSRDSQLVLYRPPLTGSSDLEGGAVVNTESTNRMPPSPENRFTELEDDEDVVMEL